jgi:eukaryotic-like serine/threonine-protein kinase
MSPDDTMRLGVRELGVGELVGGAYEVRAVLGRGGMGAVYEAWDRHLHRRVALKIATAWEDQFNVGKEGRALAAVRHPSMVAVHALGVHRDLEYLVMELVEGVTLAAHLEQRRRSGHRFRIDEVVEIARAVADGLSAVHACGISHRDVKPANIMLAPGSRVVLMDFGLFLPEFAQRDSVAGSPEYMAPEVAVRRVGPGGGHLVDLYALGVVIYELLAGRQPFVGVTAYEILKQHVESPPPPLSASRPDVPPELTALVGALLAKSAEERPQSAEFVLWQLRAIADKLKRADSAGTRKLSVLVVDDDPAAREIMRDAIVEALPDARVAVAGDGEAALKAVQRALPDVLVLDLQLPRMNGMELCMYLRGCDPTAHCRIISVSAAARTRDVQILRELGVRHYIPKSPELTLRLQQAVREIVRYH